MSGIFALAGAGRAALAVQAPAETATASWGQVLQKAKDVASRPFDPPREFTIPKEQQLTYDAYHRVNYDGRRAIWRHDSLFRLEFYPCGYIYTYPIEIYLVEDGHTTPVNYAPDLFLYGNSEVKRKAQVCGGLAGFKVLYPLNSPNKYDEVLSFLGASYFRAVPKGGRYGASTRGLAVNTGSVKGEEFPQFRSFWVERPDARVLRVYALMESPSLTGAYAFEARPEESGIEVAAQIFFRQAVDRLGVAPITSEFFYGENQGPRAPDPRGRPEVHDSDGLLLFSGNGEWLWRPLGNPLKSRESVFTMDGLRGFGLMQRDRDAAHYADTNDPQLRPNVWIEPIDPFPAGAVHLFEMSASTEWIDNIVAFWDVTPPPGPGQDLHLHYRIFFSLEDPSQHHGAMAASTRQNLSGPDAARYRVDFEGGALARGINDVSVEPVVTATGGQVTNAAVKMEKNGRVARLGFDVTRQPGATVLIRAFLRAGTDTISETWSNIWD